MKYVMHFILVVLVVLFAPACSSIMKMAQQGQAPVIRFNAHRTYAVAGSYQNPIQIDILTDADSMRVSLHLRNKGNLNKILVRHQWILGSPSQEVVMQNKITIDGLKIQPCEFRLDVAGDWRLQVEAWKNGSKQTAHHYFKII
jgi:hypothetical protein